MNTFKALRDHGLHTQKRCTLSGPVTGRARSVLFTTKDHQGCTRCLMRHCCVKDRGLRAIDAFGVTTFNTVQHLVLDADVGECAAHHDFVVTTT